MASGIRRLNVVLVAAGRSSRMGYPKFLLPRPDGRPSYLETLEMLRIACPDARHVYLLLREPSPQHGQLQNPRGLRMEFLYQSDLDVDPATTAAVGPGATLLSAFQQDPRAHWLVMPCDYPLMTAPEIRRLVAQYKDPVTCFENCRGSLEPLVAVWGPDALHHFAHLSSNGVFDMTRAIETLGGTRVRPSYDHSLFNANTREDWEHAMSLVAG